MTRSKLRLLIMDANVLIDFLDTDVSVLALISQHVGSLHVARPVVEEVAQFDESTAESLGITVVDASTEVALPARAARDLALDIQRTNPRFITDVIVDRFLARLRIGRET